MLSETSPNVSKLLTLTDRLSRSLKLFDRKADAWLGVEESAYKSYDVPRHELIITLSDDEFKQLPFAGDGFYIIMRTNLPQKIAKYYDMMHVIFSLLDATYGAFRPTVSIYAFLPAYDVNGYKNNRLLHPRYNSDLKDVSTPDELKKMMDEYANVTDYQTLYDSIYGKELSLLKTLQDRDIYLHKCYNVNTNL